MKALPGQGDNVRVDRGYEISRPQQGVGIDVIRQP